MPMLMLMPMSTPRCCCRDLQLAKNTWVKFKGVYIKYVGGERGRGFYNKCFRKEIPGNHRPNFFMVQ